MDTSTTKPPISAKFHRQLAACVTLLWDFVCNDRAFVGDSPMKDQIGVQLDKEQLYQASKLK